MCTCNTHSTAAGHVPGHLCLHKGHVTDRPCTQQLSWLNRAQRHDILTAPITVSKPILSQSGCQGIPKPYWVARDPARGRSPGDQGRNLGGMGPAKEPAVQPLSDQAGSPPDHHRASVRSYSEERPWARVPAKTEGMERTLARPTDWAN